MKSFKVAIVEIMQKITDDALIFNPNIRSIISGRLMRHSNRFAGLVYKFFYVFVFTVFFLACLILFIGFRMVMK